MIIIGLTGSIGMGKSTTADFFKQAGFPIYSADQAVHELYSSKEVCALIGQIFPSAIENNKVNREILSKIIIDNHNALQQLEDIVHPLVREKETQFIENAKRNGDEIVVLDSPLLFEMGGDKRVDKIVVVSAPESVQKARVLARHGMSEEKFATILQKQWPDAKKRANADFIIDTGKGLESAKHDVLHVIKTLLNDSLKKA